MEDAGRPRKGAGDQEEWHFLLSLFFPPPVRNTTELSVGFRSPVRYEALVNDERVQDGTAWESS